jgi:hypothetical protein
MRTETGSGNGRALRFNERSQKASLPPFFLESVGKQSPEPLARLIFYWRKLDILKTIRLQQHHIEDELLATLLDNGARQTRTILAVGQKKDPPDSITTRCDSRNGIPQRRVACTLCPGEVRSYGRSLEARNGGK